VYGVADEYGVSALKDLYKEKFDHATSICWSMDDFSHVISHVYNSAECEELRDTIAHISDKNIDILLTKDRFLRVLRETSGFAADIVQPMVNTTSLHEYRCPNFENTWKRTLLLGANIVV
jgi:hypothetical protein